ncbi:unnamed protein product [Chrysodeixis includens]|uniref:C2H2-type domain-containing protein n=1 Tax=Chrysodeixis includens TaxID=689277 RepID=A0A9N8KYK2_CHRIL|nr:unnamed protein product [Chrysodeixis includens]
MSVKLDIIKGRYTTLMHTKKRNGPKIEPWGTPILTKDPDEVTPSLLSHRTRAHPEAAARALALRCGVCARQFSHVNSLRRHLRSHSGERNFLCNVCGKALSSREHLKFHIRIHTGYKPNVCKYVLLLYPATYVNSLRRHLRSHSGERNFLCNVCGKALSSREHLKFHIRIHTGYKPNVCKYVLLLYPATYVNSLRRHLRSHSGERNFLCNVCGKALSSREHLKFHIRIHTGYKPNVCKYVLLLYPATYVNSLRRHLRSHSGERNFLCNVCGKALSSREHLKFHIRIHTGYKPNVCKYVLLLYPATYVNSLRRHLRSHSGERNFLCNVCGKALSSREHLKFHIRIHTGYKPNVCKGTSSATSALSSREHLKFHIRIHTGYKPNVCKYVLLLYPATYVNSLRRHLRSHSGERNFLCNVCGKAPSSREHLKFHIRIHTGYKPNVCKYVLLLYPATYVNSLRRHLRSHSGERTSSATSAEGALLARASQVPHPHPHRASLMSASTYSSIPHIRELAAPPPALRSGERNFLCNVCGRSPRASISSSTSASTPGTSLSASTYSSYTLPHT